MRTRSSTPSSGGVGLPGLNGAEQVGKAWLPWLFCLCTVALHPFSSSLCQSSCASELQVQVKEALSQVGKVVRWHNGQSVEMRAGQNGVFSSLHIQMRVFLQREEEILSRFTKAWTLPDQVGYRQTNPALFLKFWLFPTSCSFSRNVNS